MTTLTYKGYTGVIDLDIDEDILHGEVVDLKDTITFQGESVLEMKKAFQDFVCYYLVYCGLDGVQPDIPFSGNFLLRVASKKHKFMYIPALHSRESINAWSSIKLLEAALQNLEQTDITL